MCAHSLLFYTACQRILPKNSGNSKDTTRWRARRVVAAFHLLSSYIHDNMVAFKGYDYLAWICGQRLFKVQAHQASSKVANDFRVPRTQDSIK